MNITLTLVLTCVVILLPLLVYGILHVSKGGSASSESVPRDNTRINGLVLFDIDGTLTSDQGGVKNAMVVEACLRRNYAVGICTAGSMYTMENLPTFNWMPDNLYKFMREYDGVTFNNVASGYVAGRSDRKAYESISLDYLKTYGPCTDWGCRGKEWGYRKGYAMVKTAEALGVTDLSKVYLCDDQTTFIDGVKLYDQDLQTICCGQECGGTLDQRTIARHLTSVPKEDLD